MGKMATATHCPLVYWRALIGTALVFAAMGGDRPFVYSQQTPEVLPTAAAQIARITPDRATVGSSTKIAIEGSNFSAGVYVSFSTPAVRVVSTDRQDATKLTASVEINATAQAGAVTLYVSNPAGAATQTSFTILGPAEPPAPPAIGTETKTSLVPANAPEVKSVEPSKVGPGSQTTLKIKGKNFADGVTVSFSNPGVQVLGTHFRKASELTVDIQVASDAATGSTSLFVANPDDTEVEASFEIGGAAITTGTTTESPTTKATGSTKTPSEKGEQTFDVYNVGEAGTIFHNPSQAKGTLTLSGGNLSYAEGGKEIFSAKAAEIQEIAPNIVFGINTGTFHVILKASKTYNFASATLRPADTQSIVDSLRRALQMN